MLTVAPPSRVFPSKKVTAPVALDGETVAVKTVACPNVDGFAFEVKAMVVGVLVATHWQSGSPSLTSNGR
jgi:hypothetical protein